MLLKLYTIISVLEVRLQVSISVGLINVKNF